MTDASITTLDDLAYVINLIPPENRKVAIQAGGHWGVWANCLAGVFKTVYTFEPEHRNFQILCHTLAARDNVIKMQACLGNSAPPVGLWLDGKNGGGTHVKDEGIIPVVTIDSLLLPRLDLLYLDIEGYEYYALLSGWETICKYKPVIAIEVKDLGHTYEKNGPDAISFIESLGYRHRADRRRDKIFFPI